VPCGIKSPRLRWKCSKEHCLLRFTTASHPPATYHLPISTTSSQTGAKQCACSFFFCGPVFNHLYLPIDQIPVVYCEFFPFIIASLKTGYWLVPKLKFCLIMLAISAFAVIFRRSLWINRQEWTNEVGFKNYQRLAFLFRPSSCANFPQYFAHKVQQDFDNFFWTSVFYKPNLNLWLTIWSFDSWFRLQRNEN